MRQSSEDYIFFPSPLFFQSLHQDSWSQLVESLHALSVYQQPSCLFRDSLLLFLTAPTSGHFPARYLGVPTLSHPLKIFHQSGTFRHSSLHPPTVRRTIRTNFDYLASKTSILVDWICSLVACLTTESFLEITNETRSFGYQWTLALNIWYHIQPDYTRSYLNSMTLSTLTSIWGPFWVHWEYLGQDSDFS